MNIVLASILKPVDDVRLYHKIGLSLANHFPEQNFHFIGFASNSLPTSKPSNAHFHPLYRFRRLSIKRLFAGVRFFRKLWQLKPTTVVVATFELLLPVYVYSWFRKVNIIYDVQENYYSNIRYTQVFPAFLRWPLATSIRMIERICHHQISQYLLAETCYYEEMPFMQKKALVLANKVKKISIVHQPRQKNQLVYSGTISSDYGVFRTIDWATQLHQINSQITLVIVGFCPNPKDWEQLQHCLKQYSFIRLIGGQQTVPHAQVMQELRQATFAVMPYYVNKSVAGRIPTKFYECAALQTPILVQQNPAWKTFIDTYPAGRFIDFDDLANVTTIWESVQQTTYYQKHSLDEDIYWENEATNLLALWKTIQH